MTREEVERIGKMTAEEVLEYMRTMNQDKPPASDFELMVAMANSTKIVTQVLLSMMADQEVKISKLEQKVSKIEEHIVPEARH